ncbi:hypothetical protein [Kitasatospora sp. NPDC086791]|uniref:hypothetical protein n=1 Tax=Kitasatospora sp. NPDC086791 TaxID=3155178 RepID=UPI00343AB3AA
MPTDDLTPQEAARQAARAGVPLPTERHAAVAAAAEHIRATVAVLRELDLADTPPAAAYRAVHDHGTEVA